MRTRLRDRAGADVPVLFPEAQSQGLDCIFRWHFDRAAGLSVDRNAHRNVRFHSAVQWILSGGHQLPAEGTDSGQLPQHARRQQGNLKGRVYQLSLIHI